MTFSVCGRSGLWPFRFMAVPVCGCFGLWPFRSLAVSVCGRLGFGRFALWPLSPETCDVGALQKLIFYGCSSRMAVGNCVFTDKKSHLHHFGDIRLKHQFVYYTDAVLFSSLKMFIFGIQYMASYKH